MHALADLHRFHRDVTLANWANGGEVMRYAFLHMTELFPHAVIHRSGPIAALAEDPLPVVRDLAVETPGGRMPLDSWVHADDTTVDGIVVVRQGRVVYEAYPRMRPWDKHLLMSVSKPFASTLLALLVDRGQLEVDAPVEAYLPELRGSGWEGVAVQDVLDMASGIDCLEQEPDAYSNPAHRYYGFESSLGWNVPSAITRDSAEAYVAALPRRRAPGEAFEYTSANTFVLSWLAERLTGLPTAELISRELWSKLGAESDAFLAVSKIGQPAIHGGISATLRDVARFGLLFTPSWPVVAREPVISERSLAAIRTGRPEVFLAGDGPGFARLFGSDQPRHNSWQWDFVWADGDFYKGGYGGQGLYVSPRRDLVVAFFGCPREDMVTAQLVWCARQLAVGV